MRRIPLTLCVIRSHHDMSSRVVNSLPKINLNKIGSNSPSDSSYSCNQIAENPFDSTDHFGLDNYCHIMGGVSKRSISMRIRFLLSTIVMFVLLALSSALYAQSSTCAPLIQQAF